MSRRSKYEIDLPALKKKNLTALSKKEIKNLTSHHGAYDKFSMIHKKTYYIVKPESHKLLTGLVDNEYICNQIALFLKIPVPAHGIVNINGVRSFVQRNFVLEGNINTALFHIHRFFDNDESYSIENIITKVKKVTFSKADVKTVVRMIIFDCLVGNSDRHGGNVAFLMRNGKLRLSPIYDNVSYVLPNALGLKNKFSSRLSIGHHQRPNSKQVICELIRLGYRGVLYKVYDSLKKNNKKIQNRIDQSDLNIMQKKIFKNTLRRSLGSLKMQRKIEFKTFLPGAKTQKVGILHEVRPRVYHFSYDFLWNEQGFFIDPAIPLGTQGELDEKAIDGLKERLPSKANPRYAEYCKVWGISPDEEDLMILLSTLGHRAHSTIECNPVNFKPGIWSTRKTKKVKAK